MQLKHPNILRFIDTVEIEERGEFVIYLVTEAVTSLEYVQTSLDLNERDREKFLMMGLEQVVSAVSFLNNDCGLIHGNVCSLSVAVTETLDWKLHAFDLTTEHAVVGNLSTSPPLLASTWLVSTQYKSGELGRSEWDVIADSPPWAVDAWGLGCLIQETFSNSALRAMEDLKKIDCVPQKLKPYYQKMLASQPAKRLNPSALLESGVLKNDLLVVVTFLQNLAMKDSIEKESFFQRLSTKLADVPEPIAQRKILPLLAGALEFGGAPPSALAVLMNISKSLTQEEKEKVVVPVITKMFSSTDRSIRRCLLENIHSFGPELPNQLVEEQIYPKLQGGFADVNPYIRELTLKSMVILGPKLSARTLNQNLLKFLAKLQVDEEPGIRANTTILLGTLATSFSESTRKKVMLNAMSRALKDPFPPARIAALKSLQTTATLHNAEDVASKVIPMISPLCIDSVYEVRKLAMVCVEEFVQVVKTHQDSLEESKQPNEQNSMMGSFGWGAKQADSSPPTMIHHARDTSDRIPDVSNDSSSMPPPSSTAELSTVGDGWDDDDDDVLEDMMDAVAAERQARAKLNAVSLKPSAASAQGTTARKPLRKSVPQKKQERTSPAPKKTGMRLGAKKLSSSDIQQDDFDDW